MEWINYKGSNTRDFMKTFVEMEEERKNEISRSCLKYQEIGETIENEIKNVMYKLFQESKPRETQNDKQEEVKEVVK
jgi:hypothetical protein